MSTLQDVSQASSLPCKASTCEHFQASFFSADTQAARLQICSPHNELQQSTHMQLQYNQWPCILQMSIMKAQLPHRYTETQCSSCTTSQTVIWKIYTDRAECRPHLRTIWLTSKESTVLPCAIIVPNAWQGSSV